MIKFLICFYLLLFSGIASARDTYWSSAYDRFTIYRTSPESACSDNFANYKIINPNTTRQYHGISANGTGVYNCMVIAPPSTTPIYGSFNTRLQTCPLATPYFDSNKSVCVANDPKPPESCKADGEIFTASWPVGTIKPSSVGYNPMRDPNASDGNCCVNTKALKRCYSLPNSDDPNKAWCSFEYTRNGNLCKASNESPMPDGSPIPPDSTRDNMPPMDSNGPCPDGTVNAGLSASGIPMCIGQGTDPKNPPAAPPKVEVEKNETLPDGSTQNTKSVTTKNADGSTTTVKTVTITKSNGEKETNQEKTTTKTPSGKEGKETQPDEEKGDLCKQNPNLAICKNSTVTGKCGEIACMGDAIQCATLRAAAAMQCQQDKDIEALLKSPSNVLGTSILSGKDPMQGEIDLAMKSEEIDLSAEKLDNQGFLGGGTCLRPITVNLPGGNTYTQSFDLVCEEIQPLRYVIMFMAYVSAYMIVVRTVLGS